MWDLWVKCLPVHKPLLSDRGRRCQFASENLRNSRVIHFDHNAKRRQKEQNVPPSFVSGHHMISIFSFWISFSTENRSFIPFPLFKKICKAFLPIYGVTYSLSPMKYLAAYLLLRLGGNAGPSATDIKNVLASVGIAADDSHLGKLLSKLKDADMDKVGLLPLSSLILQNLADWQMTKLLSDGSSKLATEITCQVGEETSTRRKEPEPAAPYDHDCKEGGSCDDCGDEDMTWGLFDWDRAWLLLDRLNLVLASNAKTRKLCSRRDLELC